MSKKRVLIIDDDRTVLDSCSRIFNDEGYYVSVTDSPKRGLEMVQEERFDLILCDQKMPEIDGKDVVEMLDKRSPDTAIVMITGYPGTKSATEALQRGAEDYIVKPFNPDHLIAAAKRAITVRQQAREAQQKTVDRIARSLSFPVPAAEDNAPKTIAETVAGKVGVGKTTSPWISVLILGILAGAYIGFGGMLATTVTFDMSNYLGIGFTKFMAGAVFSLGLMLVIIAGAELFTGNNLMVSSVMTRDITLGKMLRRWGLVYMANFIGSVIVALLFVGSELWKTGAGALGDRAVAIAFAKVSLDFFPALCAASAVTGWYVSRYGWPWRQNRP